MLEVVVLPATPRPSEANPAPLDYGAWQKPIRGGFISRLDTLGNRMAMSVTMPRMRPEPHGRIWAARLMRAIGIDAQMAFPQLGFDIGNPGATVVDGAGQGGTALQVRGFVAGYLVREGQFFNVFNANGRAFLHYATADVLVGGSGTAVIPLLPLLRVSPGDDTPVNFAAPVIMGFVSGNEKGWRLARVGVRDFQFTITERR